MTSNPDFHYLNEQLLNIGSIASVAELQAFFCAQLLIKPERENAQCLGDALRFIDLATLQLDAQQLQIVEEVLELVRGQLDAGSFVALLPGKELTLNRRSEELGAWCRGFLHGFGSGGLNKDSVIPTNVAEVLKDFAKISQVTENEQEDNEENEKFFAEIVDYLHTGVSVMQAEMPGVADAPSKTSPLH